jgi:hypothetical protein
MWFSQLRNLVRGRWPARRSPSQRPGGRLGLEQLEDRLTPSNFTAASVSDLIADISVANKQGGANTITLAANTTFVLTTGNNTTDGANGLPVITKGDNLTILGNGDLIERTTAIVGGSVAPAFRLFDVANAGALTLESLTLENGWANGSNSAAEGGAIYNQGTLVLNGATVQGNGASGSDGSSNGRNGGNGQDAAGGGIWSKGSLTLENGTLVQSNVAGGGLGGGADWFGDRLPGTGGNGGNGLGGGVYVAGGTVSLTGATLSSNTAQGGRAGQGAVSGANGDGFGGGLYVASGTVSLHNDTVTSNTAAGTTSYGGGLDLAGGTVYLDAFTQVNTLNNTAGTGPDIYGSYVLQT